MEMRGGPTAAVGRAQVVWALTAIFVLSPAAALAQEDELLRVTLLSDRSDADVLANALRMELFPTIQEVVTGPGPIGTPDAMARSRALDADFGVWVDLVRGQLSVRAVDTMTWDVRSAPLSGPVEPSAFAVIASSLIEELIDPPSRAPEAERPQRLRIVAGDREYILTTTGEYDLVMRDRTVPEAAPSLMTSPSRVVLRFGLDFGMSAPVAVRIGMGFNALRTFRLTYTTKLGFLEDGRTAAGFELEVGHQTDVRWGRLGLGVRFGPGIHFGEGNISYGTTAGLDLASFVSWMWEVGRKNAMGFDLTFGMNHLMAEDWGIQLRTGFLWEIAP